MSTSDWILGIHTTTPVLGLALLPVGEDLGQGRSQCWPLDRQMAAQLHPCLREFLASQDQPHIGAVAVAVGPGSFTGSRLGVSVARVLGQQLQVPVFGYSALAAIARQVWHLEGSPADPLTVAVQMDAKRQEWYGGIYRVEQQQISVLWPEQVGSLADWEAALKNWPEAKPVDAAAFANPVPVVALAELARIAFSAGLHPSWQEVLPTYGRKPPIDPQVLNRSAPLPR
ncbi:MAG: tRNA (adenosine(37)-N6)-threonylcarbamoyltransferase complex dimerization subunit type 1 TsaB [Thermostichus sp. DG02_5_bins_236]